MNTVRILVLGLACYSGLFALACSNSGSALPDACSPVCGVNGVCDAFVSPAVCRCFPGWQGNACDACADGYEDDSAGNCVPAQNTSTVCTTGSCNGHGWCDDSSANVICTCNQGYSGKRCDTCQSAYHLDNQGNCLQDVSCANANPCSTHGTCIDSSDGSYCQCDTAYIGSTCSDCQVGYHLDGNQCVVDEHCPMQDPCSPGGVCDDSSKVVTCNCNDGYAGSLCDRCAPGFVDSGTACEPGKSCQDYPFVQNAYVYEMDFGDGETPCCFDYTGDGIPDNAYGTIVESFGSVTGMDFTQIMADEISSGNFCQLFDMQGLDSVNDDESLSLSIVWGTDSDDNYENNLDGSEEFTANDDSFVWAEQVCTMEPVDVFDSASVTDGVLMAQAVELPQVFLPSFLDLQKLMALRLKDAKLSAEASSGANGILLAQGKLGGIIAIDDICVQFNDYVALNCDCLNLDGPLMTCGVDGESYSIECSPVDSQCDPDSSCYMLGAICPLFTALFSADVDGDSDGVNESMSIGIRFSATSATLTGITQ